MRGAATTRRGRGDVSNERINGASKCRALTIVHFDRRESATRRRRVNVERRRRRRAVERVNTLMVADGRRCRRWSSMVADGYRLQQQQQQQTSPSLSTARDDYAAVTWRSASVSTARALEVPALARASNNFPSACALSLANRAPRGRTISILVAQSVTVGDGSDSCRARARARACVSTIATSAAAAAIATLAAAAAAFIVSSSPPRTGAFIRVPHRRALAKLPARRRRAADGEQRAARSHRRTSLCATAAACAR